MAEKIEAQRESRPDPDPTVLTTEQMLRESRWLKELIETRLNGMDKAIELLQTAAYKLPALIDDKILQLKDLHDEKFNSVANRFVEQDKRTEQLSLADKTAIAAALQAQKEAAGAQNDSNAASVTKQEAAFTKLIDQTQNLLSTVAKNTDDKINDLKSRIDKGEGHTRGLGDGWGYIVGAAGVLLAVVSILSFVLRHVP